MGLHFRSVELLEEVTRLEDFGVFGGKLENSDK